jgi:predicted Rossmann-fold nucleotide-binding protein
MKAKINKNHFRVAMFGSARTKKGEKTYKLVHMLAKMVAESEMDLVTGGGPGLMDAASRGHHLGRKKNKNNSSHSIGLTINLPFEQHDGYHLDIKKDFNKFSGRLDAFMRLSNVVVVAPGGVGTILEFFYTWQLLQVKHICQNVPVILLGPMWEGLIEWIKKQPLKNKLLNKEDLDNLFLVNNCTEAMGIIKKAKKEFDSGSKNVCLNIKKYK